MFGLSQPRHCGTDIRSIGRRTFPKNETQLIKYKIVVYRKENEQSFYGNNSADKTIAG